MFPGLRSLCIICCEWRYSIASNISTIKRLTLSSVSSNLALLIYSCRSPWSQNSNRMQRMQLFSMKWYLYLLILMWWILLMTWHSFSFWLRSPGSLAFILIYFMTKISLVLISSTLKTVPKDPSPSLYLISKSLSCFTTSYQLLFFEFTRREDGEYSSFLYSVLFNDFVEVLICNFIIWIIYL